MNRFQTFQEFLATQSAEIPVLGFVINLFLTAILAYILGIIYVKCTDALSNRKKFSSNFILISMTTMIIITIVKSSLALSLGLVGALSIVRFRAAIKEPAELAYLFITIAIGLGFGADQKVITIVGFAMLSGIILLRFYTDRTDSYKNLNLSVTSHCEKEFKLEKIVEILKKHCSAVELRRYDEDKDVLEAFFLVEYDSFKTMQLSKDELKKFDDSIRISFMENLGIMR